MKTPTIPQIADMLRHHVNHDNDAPRLIVEHIFPLVGVDMTPNEVRNLRSTLEDQESRIDDLTDMKDELEEMLSSVKDTAEEQSNKLEEIVSRIEDGGIDNETLKEELKEIQHILYRL